MLNQKHYSSILNLTWLYYGNKGLRQLYYRWELIENHDNIKQTYFVREMKKKFDESDPEKICNSILYSKNCVSSRSNLNNFLQRLVDRGFLDRKRDSDDISRYHLTEKSEPYLLRHNLIEMIDLMPIKHIKKVYFEISDIILDANDFLISKEKIDEVLHFKKEEQKKMLTAVLKNISDEEKHWIRKQLGLI